MQDMEANMKIESMLSGGEAAKLKKTEEDFRERLESIIREVKPKRTNIEKLDSEIAARTEGINSLVNNIAKNINLTFSNIKRREESAGYNEVLDKASTVKETVLLMKNLIKDQIAEKTLLYVIIYYYEEEKNILLNLLKDVKDSEIELQLFTRMEKMYTDQIARMQAQIDNLLGIAENSVSAKEIGIVKRFAKKTPKPIPRHAKIEEPEEIEEEEISGDGEEVETESEEEETVSEMEDVIK